MGHRMNDRTQDRVFAACGIAFVALQLIGFTLGGSAHQLTISSSATEISQALAKPVDSLSWAGAYLNLLSVGAFLGFAGWTCSKLGGGLLGQVARLAGGCYASLTVASLAVMDSISYLAGRGLDVQLARTLITVNEALFVTTWFLFAFFLLAAGLMGLRAARPALGWSALAIALSSLSAAISVQQLGQFSVLLWFGWVVAASFSLGRAKPASTRRFAAAAAAQGA